MSGTDVIASEKKNNKVIEKLKKIKTGYSQNAVIKEAIKNMKNLSIQTRENAKKVVYSGTVKAYNGITIFLTRLPLFLIFLYVMMFYVDDIFYYTMQIINTVFGFIKNNFTDFNLPVAAFGWFTTLTVILAFVAIIIILIPSNDSEWKRKIISKELGLFFIVFCGIVFWGAITSPDVSASQNVQNVVDQTTNTYYSFWDNIKCSFNYDECQKERNKGVEATSSSTEYLIKLNKPDFKYSTLEDLKAYPYDLDYEISSKAGEVYLQKLECYIGSVRDSNLVSTVDLGNEQIVSEYPVFPDNLKCDLKDIKFEKKIDENFKLIPVLYYSIVSSYSETIPVYNMDKYSYMSSNEISKKKYDLINEYRSTRPIQSNNALTFKVNKNSNLPIFYSNDMDFGTVYKVTFSFSKNTNYRDSLVSSQFKGVDIPSFLEPVCNTQGSCGFSEGQEIPTNKDMSSFDMRFKLSNIDISGREKIEEPIKLNVISTFKKQDTIALTVENTNYETATTTTTDSSNSPAVNG